MKGLLIHCNGREDFIFKALDGLEKEVEDANDAAVITVFGIEIEELCDGQLMKIEDPAMYYWEGNVTYKEAEEPEADSGYIRNTVVFRKATLEDIQQFL